MPLIMLEEDAKECIVKWRVIVKSGVSASESSGGLIDCCHLDSIFEFSSRKHFGQVIKTA